jgi:hypothetical protein
MTGVAPNNCCSQPLRSSVAERQAVRWSVEGGERMQSRSFRRAMDRALLDSQAADPREVLEDRSEPHAPCRPRVDKAGE